MGKEMILYSSKNTDIRINPLLKNDTFWLSQQDIAKLFGKGRTTIAEHILNIFNEQELIKEEVIMNVGNSDNSVGKGKTLYNLDVIIAVGYRTNSKEATQFRIWATTVIKNHIINGYTLNHKRLEEKRDSPIELLRLSKRLLDSGEITSSEALGVLEIVSNYTDSWMLFHKYDKGNLSDKGQTLDLKYKLDTREALLGIASLKSELLEKGEASELFAKMKDSSLIEGIFGNIYQTFGGNELYPSVEAKAAHLLYFIIKDHPFIDGNKRSGAFLFILFLAQNRILFDDSGNKKINERALVAITLLIAGSNPKDKTLMTSLVVNLIN